MTALRTTKNKVIVKPDILSENTPGGIIIPRTFKRRERTGTIVAISGSDIQVVSTSERVLYLGHVGDPITHDGINLMVLNYSDIVIIPE